MTEFDTLIKGGTVIDGTGTPRRNADIAIYQGRIVGIGQLDNSAKTVVDAEGMFVVPGFIDVHTHLDVQAFWDPMLSPSSRHGVTTVLGGNCGFTVAPVADDSVDYLIHTLARVEGMPLESLNKAVAWNWRTTEEYFARFRECRVALNAGFMIGHTALRRFVMGDDAAKREATPEEIDSMCGLLERGLTAGGIGFSSSWGGAHSDADGNPVPSRFADTKELIALASVCKRFEGTSLEFLPGPESSMTSFRPELAQLMIEMSLAASRPLNWNIMVPDSRTVDACQGRLQTGREARARGAKVIGLALPRAFPARFSFRTGFILDALPGWAGPMALPENEKLALLSDPESRRRLNEMAHQPNSRIHLADWATKVIVETTSPETKQYEGRIVGEIAAAEGKDPFDALLDIVVADRLRTLFTNEQHPDTPADWAARREVLTDPGTVIGASDAGAHLDMTAIYSYATVTLQELVREQHVFEFEEAVHLLTQVPAELYGLEGRGVLKVGAHADIVIFDGDRVGATEPKTVYDLPCDAARLYSESTGIDRVFVNGETIVEQGAFTDRRPGKFLRSGQDTRTPSLL
jgi:N-acyl-D-aspartate/D-glutamate deacylase